MRLTEALCSARGLAAAKYLQPSFSVLVVSLDALLLGFSRDMLDLREDSSQRGRVGSRFVGGDRVRSHPRVLQSGAKERRSSFGITVLLEQDFDDLSVLVDGTVDVTPAPGDLDVRLILSAKSVVG